MNKELERLIKKWMSLKKTGSITVNFFKGGISSVNKQETVKLVAEKEYETR